MKYGVILGDPPWYELTYSHKGMGRSAAAHYETMSLDAIKDLPIKHLAARDCALLLWVTWPMLELVLTSGLFEAWGFHYSSNAWTWIKQTKSGESKDGTGLRAMCGHTTRKCSELCLLGLRGNPPRLSKAVKDVIISPWRGAHRKPDEQYAKIAALYPGPYVELFARQRWPGWDVEFSREADTGPGRRRWRSDSYPDAPTVK
jgi:N6-adenosine-specific RNA methylase IME4